ncbi:MAG TPA: HAD-IC family P-type ATPase, partial [Myxococcota bacterium]|nr:HAD-IC family P-type ATPase [Myxococcota bacterium]
TLPDRVAPWFTAGTLVVSTLTFTGWYLTGGLEPALRATVAVLVVACPCALALAAPLASAAGLGAAARRGVLLRSGDVLRRLAEVKEVALDKTGTLTGGELEVEEAADADLRIAAALERESIHPVARALVGEAMRRGIPLAEAQKVQEVAGEGISGIIGGKRWVLGRGERGGELSLHADGEIPRRLRLKDRLRPDAARTVAALQARGLRVVMLSGDHEDVAVQIGRAAGVDAVVAELRPEGKAAWLRGRPTLFVGDGLNDGPALRSAAVGIAMAKGAASSLMIADGVVVTEALAPLLAGLRAAEYSRAAVRGNLRRSLVYNVCAVVAAAIGLVNPLVAALLMPLSSGLVIWGAARIERQVAKESAG